MGIEDYPDFPRFSTASTGLMNNQSAATKRASERSRAMVVNAASISPIVVALMIWICSPRVGASSCTSRNVASVTEALPGLTSAATRAALGTKSCRSRSRLVTTSEVRILSPSRCHQAGRKVFFTFGDVT
jgi:hypothetical protein